MKLLVSTHETQGKRKNDFCFVPDGEIVNFAFECDGEKIDGSCGCRRSMCGIEAHTGTTTMKVIDLDIPELELFGRISESIKKSWGSLYKDDPNALIIKAGADIQELKRIANCFPVGAVVEKRGRKFAMRSRAA